MKEIKIFNTIKEEIKADKGNFEMLLTKLETRKQIKSLEALPSPYFKWVFVGAFATAFALVISFVNLTTTNKDPTLDDAMLAVRAMETNNVSAVKNSAINEEF